jgi:hypothetical protein
LADVGNWFDSINIFTVVGFELTSLASKSELGFGAELRFECENCPKTFASKISLQSHLDEGMVIQNYFTRKLLVKEVTCVV